MEIIKFLVDKGAKIDHEYKKYSAYYETKISPLAAAIKRGDVEILKYLIEKGIDVNETYSDVDTNDDLILPLQDAIVQKKEEIVRVLVENGADANKNELMIAAIATNRLKIVKILVEHGCDINFGGIFLACEEHKSYEILEYLLKHGTNVNMKIPRDKTTFDCPLSLYLWNNDFLLLKIILDNGADINLDLGEILLFKMEFIFFFIELL